MNHPSLNQEDPDSNKVESYLANIPLVDADADGEPVPEVDLEEKARLIAQVMELQNTLDDLSRRVDTVKEENMCLKSENQVLGQYIENLMSASSVFQSTTPKPRNLKM
ncbi:short coiled-coil protein B-like isoform X2 [Artemia franciscana]